MTEILQKIDAPKKRALHKNHTTQTITANLVFPLLLVIPGVKAWVAANPEAFAAVQGILNVIINKLQEKFS